MTLKVTTNNVPRDIINAWELSPKQRETFDYLEWDLLEAGHGSASDAQFVSYRGELYHLQDICEASWGSRMPQGLEAWSNYASDSFFSGIVVRHIGPDYETVVMGRYYVTSDL